MARVEWDVDTDDWLGGASSRAQQRVGWCIVAVGNHEQWPRATPPGSFKELFGTWRRGGTNRREQAAVWETASEAMESNELRHATVARADGAFAKLTCS